MDYKPRYSGIIDSGEGAPKRREMYKELYQRENDEES